MRYLDPGLAPGSFFASTNASSECRVAAMRRRDRRAPEPTLQASDLIALPIVSRAKLAPHPTRTLRSSDPSPHRDA
ncbi:hypothetical protein IEQ11_20445 [Lysobacter capsici]|uniref:hypothetical protein n=1 Tax=Lysobacter capsici TaxID=435897 RepID=UPI00177DF361|nr:hypothetical protein [Lysobacter capsici]UOF14073.1 hypothetical protein IEQ11_20445 [Lysobacter capsici]